MSSLGLWGLRSSNHASDFRAQRTCIATIVDDVSILDGTSRRSPPTLAVRMFNHRTMVHSHGRAWWSHYGNFAYTGIFHIYYFLGVSKSIFFWNFEQKKSTLSPLFGENHGKTVGISTSTSEISRARLLPTAPQGEPLVLLGTEHSFDEATGLVELGRLGGVWSNQWGKFTKAWGKLPANSPRYGKTPLTFIRDDQILMRIFFLVLMTFFV